MPQCWVICLYLNKKDVSAVCIPLPPMTLPQSVLPDGARFAGAGAWEQDDAYLYVVKGTGSGAQRLEDEELLGHLVTLAGCNVPQDFSLMRQTGRWVLETRDLDQDVF